MIDGNTIKFGYGDIIVCSREELGRLSLIPVDDKTIPVGTGLSQKDWEERDIHITNNPIMFNFISCKEINRLKTELQNVMDTDGGYKFVYEGYTFDFTNYNMLSVEAVMKHLQVIKNRILFLMAC